MRKLLVSALLCLACALSVSAQEGYVPSEGNLAAREEFSRARLGIFIHWGLYSMLGDGEWVMQNRGIRYSEYSRLAAGFCPSKFDAGQWVRIFKGAGAKYLTVTSRHHDGFSMFKSDASAYNIVDATPFGRDVIAELAEACCREGLKLHLYYSQADWGREDYWPLGGTGHNSGRKEGGDWNSYLRFMNAQLTELLTKYGEIGAIWYDGMWDKHPVDREEWRRMWNIDEQYALIHSLQPSCLVGSNHHSASFPGEDIQIFEKDLPGENLNGFSTGQTVSLTLPLETCQTMNNSWGYNITDENYMSADDLIRYLVKTAGKGANLLINVGPRPDGTLPDEAVERLEALGRWMDVYGGTIYATSGGFVKEQPWGVTTRKGNTLYVHVLKHQDSITIPVKDNRLVSAIEYASGAKVPVKQSRDAVVVTVPSSDVSTPDTVIELTFRKAL